MNLFVLSFNKIYIFITFHFILFHLFLLLFFIIIIMVQMIIINLNLFIKFNLLIIL